MLIRAISLISSIHKKRITFLVAQAQPIRLWHGWL